MAPCHLTSSPSWRPARSSPTKTRGWDFQGLGPGAYALRLHSRNLDNTFTLSMGTPPPVLTNVWTGEVVSPFVKVSLVDARRR
jgi:hypothetical protein